MTRYAPGHFVSDPKPATLKAVGEAYQRWLALDITLTQLMRIAYADGWSYRKIADACGCTAPTVAKRVKQRD